jgi:hypothetical protein
MTELHDRSTDTADHRPDSGDRLTVPVDESGKENWAEDAEPLTRSQYAKLIRQQSAEELSDATTGEKADAGDAHPDAATDADHAREQLPQPETRREDPVDHQSGADRPADDETGTEPADQAEQAQPDAATDPAAHQEPHEPEPQERSEEQGPQFTVVEADTSDRTFGDTTPTGIGLKPTGDQLLGMESDKRSRLDGLRREWERDEVLDGLHEETEQDATTVQSILSARPPEGHPVHVVPDAPQMAPVMPAGPDAGMIAGSGLMVGVMLVELGRQLNKMRKQGKEVG